MDEHAQDENSAVGTNTPSTSKTLLREAHAARQQRRRQAQGCSGTPHNVDRHTAETAKKGFLWKQGRRYPHTWKLRYFVLTPASLDYFTGVKGSPKGEFTLSKSTKVAEQTAGGSSRGRGRNQYEWRFEFRLVEVKGPSDALSHRQQAWLAVLSASGVDARICKITDQRPSATTTNRDANNDEEDEDRGG